MEFGATDCSIRKTHQSLSFELPPSPSTIAPTEKREDSDTGSSRNRLDVSNVSNNLKVHSVILLQTLLNNPSQRLTLALIASRPAVGFGFSQNRKRAAMRCSTWLDFGE
jgi:hypothetical protein